MVTGLFLEHELGKGKNEMPQYCCRKGDPFQGTKLGSCLLLLLSHFSRVRLYVTLCNGSPPGSPIPGILQARILEWVAISFSNAWKWKVKVKSLSRVRLVATPWTAAYQAPPSMGFSRQEYWSGVPLPSPGSCLTLRNELSEETHALTKQEILL